MDIACDLGLEVVDCARSRFLEMRAEGVVFSLIRISV
tara:strand:- start:4532 stop:4642 length:111 start_codon:yes stop_codon:yes gene_type:complete